MHISFLMTEFWGKMNDSSIVLLVSKRKNTKPIYMCVLATLKTSCDSYGSVEIQLRN